MLFVIVRVSFEWMKRHPGYNLHITGMPAIATGSGCSSNSHAVVNPQDMEMGRIFGRQLLALTTRNKKLLCSSKGHRY